MPTAASTKYSPPVPLGIGSRVTCATSRVPSRKQRVAVAVAGARAELERQDLVALRNRRTIDGQQNVAGLERRRDGRPNRARPRLRRPRHCARPTARRLQPRRSSRAGRYSQSPSPAAAGRWRSARSTAATPANWAKSANEEKMKSRPSNRTGQKLQTEQTPYHGDIRSSHGK